MVLDVDLTLLLVVYLEGAAAVGLGEELEVDVGADGRTGRVVVGVPDDEAEPFVFVGGEAEGGNDGGVERAPSGGGGVLLVGDVGVRDLHLVDGVDFVGADDEPRDVPLTFFFAVRRILSPAEVT